MKEKTDAKPIQNEEEILIKNQKCPDCGDSVPKGWTYCEKHASVRRKEYGEAIRKAEEALIKNNPGG